MQEPRVHFAIVCASHGCPRLVNEAYTAGNLEKQLATSSQALFADPTKCFYDASKNQLYLSPILQWYAGDFGTNEGEQLKTITPFLPAALQEEMKKAGQTNISYLEYDWKLNEQATAQQDDAEKKGARD